jgi:hypothetical protein
MVEVMDPVGREPRGGAALGTPDEPGAIIGTDQASVAPDGCSLQVRGHRVDVDEAVAPREAGGTLTLEPFDEQVRGNA